MIQANHGGNASFVSFVHYLAGRQIGYYWPIMLPTYLKKNDENKKTRIDYMNIMKEELFRKSVRQKIGF